MATHLLFLAQEVEEPSPLIPHTAEWIVGLVAFVLLFLFLRAKVFPMFEKAYADRTATIEGGIQRAEEDQAEARSLLEQYRAQLAEARADASRIRTEAQSDRRSIVEAARAEAQQAAEAVTERSRASLEAEFGQARAQLSREVGRLAVDLAEKVVGANLADTERTRTTVDRFLDDLEATAASVPVGAARGTTAAPPTSGGATALGPEADPGQR